MKLIFSTFSFLWFSLAYLSVCDASCYPACCNDTFSDLYNHQEERSIMGSEDHKINYQENTAALLQKSLHFLLYHLMQLSQSRDFYFSLTTSSDTSQQTSIETLSISFSNNILKNLNIHNHQGRSSTELMDTVKHEMKYKKTMQAPQKYFYLLPPSATVTSAPTVSRSLCTAFYSI